MLGLFKVKVTTSDGTEHEALVGHADLYAFERAYGVSSAKLFGEDALGEWTAFVAHAALKRRGKDVGDWELFRDQIDLLEVHEWKRNPKA